MIVNVNEEIIQYLISFGLSQEQAEIELQNLIENKKEVEFYHRMYINEKEILSC